MVVSCSSTSQGSYLLGEPRIDVLEVNMDDPVAVPADELGGIGAADREMSGVEADLCIALGEDAFDLVARLDEAPGVRVQGGGEPVICRQLLHPLQVVGEPAPVAVVERLWG